MIKRKQADLYPEFHVTFVKNKKIADVTPVSLTDLGFMNDVTYPQQSIDELPNEIAIEMEAEFIYLIEELLPRDIQDLFYKIGLEPRPAYWKLFERAANDLGLERYTNPNDNKFNQFVSHTQDGIIERFDMGWTLSEIYENTCVTKTMMNDVAYEARKPEKSVQDAWNYIETEIAIFRQNLEYERNVTVTMEKGLEYTFDFMLYREGQPVLAVQIDDDLDFLMAIDLKLQNENKERYQELCYREKYCEEHQIALLRLNENEYYWNDTSQGKLISKTIKDPSFAKKHDEEMITILQEDVEDDENC